MFGLPAVTSWVLFGSMGFWILYTAIFMILTRKWPKDSEGGEE